MPQKEDKYDFMLFVTGMSIHSMRAIEKIKSICDKYLKNRYSLKIVDVYKSPEEVKKHNIIACPTLVKKLPVPIKILIGDLSDDDKVLSGLGLKKV